MLLIGGAGSGNFTAVLSHIMAAPGRGGAPPHYAIFDPSHGVISAYKTRLAKLESEKIVLTEKVSG
ncbi:hypothetical protein [Sulfitobacter alexandrii]|uniref:hypothetical protein n=1 Tax=Sulfitobacter alexandrii TaxID=1917485 RepID=UPI0012EC9B9A|nr:hypothetical protein [Sulfitobacter alexandrii]